MAKEKYKFNPHTLTFDVISHPLRKKIAKIAIHLFVNITIAATLTYIYFIINKIDIDDFDDPKEFIEICSREVKKMSRDLRYILKL